MQARHELEMRLSDIVSFEALQTCLDQSFEQDIMAIEIFHSFPIATSELPLVGLDQVMFCSDSVKSLIYDNIKEESEEEMRKFTRYLKIRASYCSPLLGSLFKEYYRRFFAATGMETCAWPLTQPGNVVSIRIPPGESIDAIQVESADGIINVFKMAVTSDHLESSHAILRQLVAGDKLGAYLDSKLCVRLIFVIPDGVQHDFDVQKITTQNISTETALFSVPWLQGCWKRSLASQGVLTVGDMIGAAPNNEFIQKLESEARVLSLMKGHIRDSQLNLTINILQYYIVISGFYP